MNHNRIVSSGPTPASSRLLTSLQRYLELALYLLVLTGFGVLASTGGVGLPAVVLVFFLLVVRGWFIAARREVVLAERWITALTLGYVVYYLCDYFLISRSFLTATVHLVLFAAVVRMFSLRRERDRYMLVVLAFLMVLAAAVLTVDSLFLLLFTVFLLIAVVAFILLEMRQSADSSAIPSRESARIVPRRVGFWLVGGATALVALILLLASAIFFVLPRVSSRYLASYTPNDAFASGFSDRVQLGRIGRIQQSNAVVMHVRIEGDTKGTHDLKWRGVALNVFTGKTWRNALEQSFAARQPDGAFAVASRPEAGAVPTPSRRRQVIWYHVVLEPMGSNVFFLAPWATEVRGNYGRVATDRAGAVFDMDTLHQVNRYSAVSDIATPSPQALREARGEDPPGILLTYLQLPPLDARIPQLVQQVTASSGSDYDRATAIESYLLSHYAYTLELPRHSPPDPLADFLFERKRGHCEYFASAMTVMLRAARIPARLVNGFRGGEFNDVSGSYVIRARNAHSWVEAYFPGQGWVSFDPTPGGPPAGNGLWDRAMLYADALSSFWREWIVEYDAAHQQELREQAQDTGITSIETLRGWAQRRYDSALEATRTLQDWLVEFPAAWTAGGLLVCLVLLLLVNLRRVRAFVIHRRLRKSPQRFPRAAASVWYEEMAGSLAQRGWRKAAGQTPVEFAAGIEDEAVRASVVRFTACYESARFGESAEDAARLPELCREVAGAGRD